MINDLLQNTHPSWKPFLKLEQQKPYFKALNKFLIAQYSLDEAIYPPKEYIFEALKQPVLNTKVVILGQDPYHQPGQAHGLAFSVLPGIKTPPSLRNILKELKNNNPTIEITGNCLSPWAKQGVLLLNTILTVKYNQPLSHAMQGWEQFTQAIILYLSTNCPYLVFLLWGNNATQNSNLIAQNHIILTSTHPSPLSANRGFMGCNHFNLCNINLQKNNLTPIIWDVPI